MRVFLIRFAVPSSLAPFLSFLFIPPPRNNPELQATTHIVHVMPGKGGPCVCGGGAKALAAGSQPRAPRSAPLHKLYIHTIATIDKRREQDEPVRWRVL